MRNQLENIQPAETESLKLKLKQPKTSEYLSLVYHLSLAQKAQHMHTAVPSTDSNTERGT